MAVLTRSRSTILLALAVMTACGSSPRERTRVVTPTSPAGEATRPTPDPDLHREPPARVLAIDWREVKIASDADALALWRQIAPTGFDWEEKLGEVPHELGRPLAIALLRGGNFTCAVPPRAGDCVAPVFDVPEPAHAAGFDDPCLRRLLALWAIEQLELDDLAQVHDALRAIAAIPPPESELVVAALQAPPETAQDLRLELAAIAWRAGQRDVVATAVGKLDEGHLIEAVAKHHIDPALDVLSAAGHRGIYLQAVLDEALGTKARTMALTELLELSDKLPADLDQVLVKAAAARDCTVAATAARVLAASGDRRFVPRRPRTRKPADLMRALCVLASYEQLQGADEPSLLAGFVPKQGLERVTIAYDPLGEVDGDGDGDPHTERTIDRVTGDALVLPEIDDLVRALRRCAGTTCRSDDREFRFGLKVVGGASMLTRLEVVERPPCPRSLQ